MTRIEGATEYTAPAAGSADPVRAQVENLIGKEKADKLLSHFKRTKNGLSCIYYDGKQQVNPSGKGQKASPIVIGSLKDLSFYDILERPCDPYRQIRVTMSYLEKYLLIPTKSGKLVFVSDDHNHAVFAWALAQDAGIVREPSLIHIDGHPDYPVDDPKGSYYKGEHRPITISGVAELVREKMSINYIVLDAMKLEMPSGRVVDPHGIFFVDPSNTGQGVQCATNRLKPFDGSCDLTEISLELADSVIDKAKAAGRSVICDIDLDYFLPDFKPYTVCGLRCEETIDWVAGIARRSDFVTIATSPNYLAIPKEDNQRVKEDNQRVVVRELLTRIIREMDR